MKLISIVGTRPQFIKTAMLNMAIREQQLQGADITSLILHTGQHYDFQMSEIFFRDLNIPSPNWNLGCKGSVEEMAAQIVPILKQEQPDYVLVCGNTNSTMAGARAAEQAGCKLVHVEAGLRSYRTDTIEEFSRVSTDHRSNLLFCPTPAAVENLKKEGIKEGVYYVGDVMLDAANIFGRLSILRSQLLENMRLEGTRYALATIHRAETTDKAQLLENVLTALGKMDMPVVLPLHPRTRKAISANPHLKELMQQAGNIILIPSQSYLDMAILEKCATIVLTDSGGVQKEAFFYRRPCLVLREETEWPETVASGWAQLVGTDTERILEGVKNPPIGKEYVPEMAAFGNGTAAEQIIRTLLKQ